MIESSEFFDDAVSHGSVFKRSGTISKNEVLKHSPTGKSTFSKMNYGFDKPSDDKKVIEES